uniref:ANK_REP_REGION domain-containing protein n=1 Tax=Romanomermis culicivorax TaxID=13658 RepID=A0A915KUS4_ROMCU
MLGYDFLEENVCQHIMDNFNPISQQCSSHSSSSSLEPYPSGNEADIVSCTNNEISAAPRSLEQTTIAPTDLNGNPSIDEAHFILPLEDELPEPLTDFILNYSWKDTKSNINDDKQKQAAAACKTQSPPTSRSSPFSSVSLPGDSPAAPQPTRTLTSSNSKINEVADTGKATQQQQQLFSENGGRKSARQKFRESIKNDEFNRAWIWALRCSQSSPGALFYRDADGDSFLHIVVWQKDMAKIYALTELMKSNDAHQTKPFDLKNKLNETPLFLAVEKRLKDVVAYGLENCANPNIQAFNRDQDTPLHYAAARSMVAIVQLLCECPLVNVNMMNGAGLTPLLCAVKSHRNKEEENQSLIDNKSIAGTLLKYGTDPKIYDAKTGKNILHYAVECMDPQMIRIFRDHMDKEILHALVNQRCYASQTPFELLAATEFARGIDYVGTEEGQLIRLEMGRLLTELGAELPRMTAGSGTESPDFFVSYDETFFP